MPNIRRFHRKSRMGCAQCKTRHVKCDGRPPQCKNCERRGLACTYANLRPTSPPWREIEDTQADHLLQAVPTQRGLWGTVGQTRDPSTGSQRYISHNSTEWLLSMPSPTADAPLSPNLTYWDLHLMCQFCVKTIDTLGKFRSASGIQYSPFHIHGDSSAEPFVIHGLLSVAAWHLAYLDESQRTVCSQLGLRHYNTALRLFSASIKDITIANLRAVVASMMLVLIIFMAQSRVCGYPAGGALSELLEPLSIMRRSENFFKSIVNRLGEGSVSTLFHRCPKKPLDTLRPTIDTAIQDLKILIECSENTAKEKIVYQETIETLSYSFQITETKHSDWESLHFWPGAISTDYISLLLKCRPIALVVLAHWAVSVLRAPDAWYVGDWAKDMIRAVASKLGKHWVEALRWPLGEIGAI